MLGSSMVERPAVNRVVIGSSPIQAAPLELPMEKNSKIYRFFLILARTIYHRVGKSDTDKPDIPVLTMQEALISFFIKFFIVIVNFITCAFVIANVIHHW